MSAYGNIRLCQIIAVIAILGVMACAKKQVLKLSAVPKLDSSRRPGIKPTKSALPSERVKKPIVTPVNGKVSKTGGVDRSTSLGISSIPNSYIKAMEYFAKGIRLSKDTSEEAISEAFGEFKKALEAHPDFYLADYNLGVLSDRRGDAIMAEKYLRDALRKERNFTPAVICLTNIYARRGELHRAINFLKYHRRRFPGNQVVWNRLLSLYIGKGGRRNYAKVLMEAKQILKKNEKNTAAMVNLGMAYYGQKKYDLAMLALKNANNIEKENAHILNKLGLVYLKLGNRDAASKSFEEAIKVQPNHIEALNNRAVLLLKTGQYKKALSYLKKAAEISPNYIKVILNLGTAYRRLNDVKNALKHYKMVLRLKPNYVNAFFNLGILYLDNKVPGYDKIKRYQTAIAYLQKYKKGKPRLPRDSAVLVYLTDAEQELERAIKSRDRQRRRRLKKLKEAAKKAAIKAAGKKVTGEK